MNWDRLKVFLAIAEAGSLAGAARRLRLSQATIWRHARALEESLRVTLFERHASGYVLTPMGSRFLESLAGLPRTVDAACEQLRGETVALEGEVRVSAPEFVGLMVGRALPALCRRHPSLVVELLTGSPVAALVARDVDIALRVEREAARGLVLEAVFSIPAGVYAAPVYLRRFGVPAAIDDMAGHRLIEFDHSLAHIAPDPWLRRGGKGATIVFRSSSPHARMAAARAGGGLAMLPEPLVGNEAGLRRVLSSAEVGSFDLILFVSGALRREGRVVAVRDFLLEQLATYRRDSGIQGRRRSTSS